MANEGADQRGNITENVLRSKAADALSECRFTVGDPVRVRFTEDEDGRQSGTVVESHWCGLGRCYVVHVRLGSGRVVKVDAGRVTRARGARRASA